MKRVKTLMTAAALTFSMAGGAYAGPFILAGTDADDHGFESGGTNMNGWFFMQRALENLAASSELTNTNMTVAYLGSTGSALTAAQSAFDLSTLAGSWSSVAVSTADFNDFFNNTGTGTTLDDVSILMMDSGFNVGGGTNGTNFDPYATTIDAFLGTGGGLFSQANGYSWLTTLLPSVSTPGFGDIGIELTAAGSAAFPGLTDADLSAGPYHNWFENTGDIPILAVDDFDGNANDGRTVIIGSSGGSITDPDPVVGVPEPGSLALLGLGLAGLGAMRRREQD